MHSSLIGKIQKAQRYAEEPHRVRFVEFSATFQGEHDQYRVSFQEGRWNCTCNFFPGWGVCSHTMCLQKLMGRMVACSEDPLAQAGADAEPPQPVMGI